MKYMILTFVSDRSRCALRYGEIAELRRRDLDLDHGKFASAQVSPGWTAIRSWDHPRPPQASETYRSHRTSFRSSRTTSPITPDRAPTLSCFCRPLSSGGCDVLKQGWRVRRGRTRHRPWCPVTSVFV